MITRKQLIEKYLDFFVSKNHKVIENSSLVPKEDPTVLFTTAGMHPLVPYLLGNPHFQGKRLCNVQRCLRTDDIDEVGDNSHHTFFEMLGNWSLGDYWKKEAIEYTLEFFTKILKIPKEKIAISVFQGDKEAPKDTETEKIWKGLEIKRITFLGKKDNWWDPAGITGPCGPDTEIFYWTGKSKAPEKFDPKDKRWIEIGNNVLMQYYKEKNGKYLSAKQKNIDFGGGVERTIAALNNLEDNYLTDCFLPIIKKIEKLSKKTYDKNKKEMRIIADHVKAAVFIISDGIMPSNTEQGYVLRKLIRRAIRYGRELGLSNFTKEIAEPVFGIYEDYSSLKNNKKLILEELEKEEQKFSKTLEQGEKIFSKLIKEKKEINGKTAFLLYQSYGFPLELIQETAKNYKIKVDSEGFKKELKKHQELSRTTSQGKFKSGLADHSETTTKLHTATHLLLGALRQILNDINIYQKGSNITPERLRLDFNFPRKLTEQELDQIESLVNDQIKKCLEVKKEEMTLNQAKKNKAIGSFDERYGEMVFVYSIGNFSKEICSGPHVKNTKEIGHFKIIKEEASSAGVRRIKAILE